MKQYQRRAHGEETDRNIRITLALLGCVENPSQSGVRILAIDGGGSRYVCDVMFEQHSTLKIYWRAIMSRL